MIKKVEIHLKVHDHLSCNKNVKNCVKMIVFMALCERQCISVNCQN